MPEQDNQWELLVGCTVEIRKNGKLVRIAGVEDVTADASIIWLRADGNDGRKIITSWDGFDVSIVSSRVRGT